MYSTKRGAIGLTVLALAIGLTACSTVSTQSGEQQSSKKDDASTEVTVGLTYIPNVQFAPVYVAESEGLFTSSGNEVELRHHGSDEGLFSALSTGDEQITIASGDEVLQARAAGVNVIAIGAYYHKYPVEIVVEEDSPINSIKDLKGKKVGLPGEFGSNWFGFLADLQSAGLSRDDVEVVSVGYTQAASLVSGDVDAIVAFSNSESVQLEKMGVSSRALPREGGTPPLVGASIVSTEEWVTSNPDQARAIVAAITEGSQRVIEDPSAAVGITAKWDETLIDDEAIEGATATLEATIPLLKGPEGKATSVQDLETWNKMGPFLAKILDNPVLEDSLDGAVTNEYTS